MKTMKLIYPLAFALAVTLAATGCRTQPVDVTPICRDRRAAASRSNRTRAEHFAATAR